jgi:hypothetical protein
VVSGVTQSEEESTYEVKCCNADDNEAFKDELDTEDPSPAIYRIGSRCGTDGKKSNERRQTGDPTDDSLTISTVGSGKNLGCDSEHDTRDTGSDTRECLTSDDSCHASGSHGHDGANGEKYPDSEDKISATVDIGNDGEDGTKCDGRDSSSLDNPNSFTCSAV